MKREKKVQHLRKEIRGKIKEVDSYAKIFQKISFTIFLSLLIFGFIPADAGSYIGPITDFINDYPREKTPGWTDNVNGVAHDENNWYFTDQYRLYKIPVNYDLNNDIHDYPDDIKEQKIPIELSNQGYNHFGDLDQAGGYLFIPLEGKFPRLILVYRASDLSYIGYKETQQSSLGWIAYNPRDGYLYSSEGNVPNDPPHGLYKYALDLDKLSRTLDVAGSITLSSNIFYINETDGRPLSPALDIMQGGAFTPWGDLYLINGYYDISAIDSRGGIHLFGRNGRLVNETRFNSDGDFTGGINFYYEPEWSHYQEPEGIDWWDMGKYPRSPGIAGQLHALLLQNEGIGDDDIFFKHYNVNYKYTSIGDYIEVHPDPDVNTYFTKVTISGDTDVAKSTTNPSEEVGSQFLGTYYDITTTATYTGSTTVCLKYDDNGMSSDRENYLRIRHLVGLDWKDVTKERYPDTANNTICGEVSSLSLFGIAYDNTPPETIIDQPNGQNGWFIANTIYLNATDNSAGIKYTNYSVDNGAWISNPGSGLTLKTPVVLSDGIHSLQYYSVDNAGNVESINTQTVKIDKTPPDITINIPIDRTEYLLNQPLFADWSVSDPISGIESATGTYPSGSTIDTTLVGTKTFSVNAKDNAGNTATKNIAYYIHYKYSGILMPIKADGSSNFKLGSTIPVKFQLQDANGNYITTATASIYLTNITNGASGNEIEGISTSNATTGNLFRYDNVSNQYIFDLGTKILDTGAWQIRIELDDGSSKYVNIELR